MIWTLVVFGISMLLLRRFAFPRDPRRPRPAPEGDRGLDRHRRAHARRRPTSCSPSTASACKEAREQAEEIVTRARRTAEDARARGDRGGARAPRAAARADQARHRGRDAPRDRRDPRRGRQPDGPRGREGDAQDADREPTSGASSRRRSASSTSRSLAVGELGASRWKRSPPSTRGRCSRSAIEHGRLDVVHEQLGQLADAIDANRDLQVFFFSPYFSTRGEAGRPRAHC